MYKYNMSIANFHAKLGSYAAMKILDKTSPQPMPDENGRPGWSYTKMMGAEYMSYFIYRGEHETARLRDIKGMWFVGSVDLWTNVSNELPYIVIFTKPKRDGTDARFWHHSEIRYNLVKEGNIIRVGERCMFKVGCPDIKVEDARVLKMDSIYNLGEPNEDDEILTIRVRSDYAAASMSCYVENMGVQFHQHHRHTKETTINMKLLG